MRMLQSGGKRSGSRHSSDVPMKVRRRQSDARWRANVASCYETLKHVIPINKRATKRQISKAFILQETSKHINFLESILEALLEDKAHQTRKADEEKWVRCKVNQIKQNFVETQKEKIEALNTERKYKRARYKLYISDNLIQMHEKPHVPGNQSKSRHKLTDRRQHVKAHAPAEPVHTVPTANRSSCNGQNTTDGEVRETKSVRSKPEVDHQVVPSPMIIVTTVKQESYQDSYEKYVKDLCKVDVTQIASKEGTEKTVVEEFQHLHEVPDSTGPAISPLKTPQKIKVSKRSVKQKTSHVVPGNSSTERTPVRKTTPKHKDEISVTRFNDCQKQEAWLNKTPSKSRQDEHSTLGFTPVKLPHCYLTPQKSPWTPGCFSDTSSKTESAFETDDEVEGQSLLCHEPMWLSSDDDDERNRNEKTPAHRKKKHRAMQKQKSRRRLISDQSETDVEIPLSSGKKNSKMKHSFSVPSRKRKQKHPKCRKTLKMSYLDIDEDEDTERQVDKSLNPFPCENYKVDSGAIEQFDGYLMFYKHMLNSDPEQSSEIIRTHWETLDEEEKQTMISLAKTETTESQDSSLSDDLVSLKVIPMTTKEKMARPLSRCSEEQLDAWPLPPDIEEVHTDNSRSDSSKSPQDFSSDHYDASRLFSGVADDDTAPFPPVVFQDDVVTAATDTIPFSPVLHNNDVTRPDEHVTPQPSDDVIKPVAIIKELYMASNITQNAVGGEKTMSRSAMSDAGRSLDAKPITVLSTDTFMTLSPVSSMTDSSEGSAGYIGQFSPLFGNSSMGILLHQ